MNDASLSFSEWLSLAVAQVEQCLHEQLPAQKELPQVLHEAMRYAVLGPGKRVRAALVYATGLACSHDNQLEPQQLRALSLAAAAVEMIHAYSLVHDDLPCMDDDDMRRGRPTCHIQYGEAMALLAADALQPLAFQQLAQMPISSALVTQAVDVLAQAAGSHGMVGGQVIDVANVGNLLELSQLQQMHRMKTGAMIEASVRLGAIALGAASAIRQSLEDYAAAIGLAFQVVDDILDVTADSQALGKTAGKDAQAHKPTYVSLMGLEQSQQFAEELHRAALKALLPIGGQAQRLKELADFIICRHY
ncbi:polyprenyl synthetase family protein [Pelistega europaea]|uniref:Polyprenyl synthetase family protein n=1 Tax=Pelistega europaea TaxID=106147 RepID=A0A7Y4LA87_9BURK|nr:farnesyl diphosphate synthase [Pelistega europaea]NOL49802.1 polyprenyl synthetase family protein [Pelistega europaea]